MRHGFHRSLNFCRVGQIKLVVLNVSGKRCHLQPDICEQQCQSHKPIHVTLGRSRWWFGVGLTSMMRAEFNEVSYFLNPWKNVFLLGLVSESEEKLQTAMKHNGAGSTIQNQYSITCIILGNPLHNVRHLAASHAVQKVSLRSQ